MWLLITAVAIAYCFVYCFLTKSGSKVLKIVFLRPSFISFSPKPQTFLCVFTLGFHLPSTRKRLKRRSFSLKTITFENGLQSGKILEHNDIVFIENDPSTRQRYEQDMKTIENDMKTYSCRRCLVCYCKRPYVCPLT